MNSMDCGARIWVVYPKCGLTRARYSVRLTSVLSMNLVFLFKYPNSLVAREERKKENRQPRKLNYTFPTETLAWLFSLKEITPSTDGKMIKRLLFDNYFPPIRHSRRFCKSRSRMIKAIAFSRWNEAGANAHYLVLRKSCPRSFPCIGISRSLLRTWSKHSGTQI